MSLLVENRELLHRFRDGEPAALKRVFEHYAPQVAALLRHGFGFRAGGQRVYFAGYDRLFDLEDVLQEVFRRAFAPRARDAYDGLRPFKAYLGAIARNTVINDYLARKRMLARYRIEASEPRAAPWTAAHDPLGEGHLHATGDPEHDTEAGELRSLIRTFKAGLTGREHTVFALRFEQGLSHTEIQSQTGLSASKVKTSEARIRKTLLRYLHKRGYLTQRKSAPLAPLHAPRAMQGEES